MSSPVASDIPPAYSHPVREIIEHEDIGWGDTLITVHAYHDRMNTAMRVYSDDAVSIILDKLNLDMEEHSIHYNGQELFDDGTFADHGIQDNAQIEVRRHQPSPPNYPRPKPIIPHHSGGVPVYVKIVDGSRESWRIPLDWTVIQVKEVLSKNTGFSVEQIRLIHRGQPMIDNETLANMGVKDGSILHMLISCY